MRLQIRDFRTPADHPGSFPARKSAGGVSRRRRCDLRSNMIDPVQTQCMVVDLEFPRGRLVRRARGEKALDPHAFEMIASLTSPGSRTIFCRATCYRSPKSRLLKKASGQR